MERFTRKEDQLGGSQTQSAGSGGRPTLDPQFPFSFLRVPHPDLACSLRLRHPRFEDRFVESACALYLNTVSLPPAAASEQ